MPRLLKRQSSCPPKSVHRQRKEMHHNRLLPLVNSVSRNLSPDGENAAHERALAAHLKGVADTLSAAGASSERHDTGPGTASAALEGSAANAVPSTLSRARSRLAASDGSLGRSRGAGGLSGRGGGLGGLSGGRDRLLGGLGRGSRGGGRVDGNEDTAGVLSGRLGRSGRSLGGLRSGLNGSRLAGAGGTSTLRSGEDIGSTVLTGHRVAGVGELNIGAFGGAALVANVGDEHVGQSGQSARATLGAGNGDRGAVHVHLAVADLVEPSPGQRVLTSRQVFGNGEVVGIGSSSVGIVADVASGVLGRAATLNGVDDLPDGVLVGLEVSGDRDLAGTTTVGSTTLELELLGAALGVDVAGTALLVDAIALLAREIGTTGIEGTVVEGSGAIGNGVAHEHVGVGHGGQGEGESGLGEHFDGFCGDERLKR